MGNNDADARKQQVPRLLSEGGLSGFSVGSEGRGRKLRRRYCQSIGIVPRPASANIRDLNESQTLPIHLRFSQTAWSEVRLRRSKMLRAAEDSLPFLRLLYASLALMATNCSTLGSR